MAGWLNAWRDLCLSSFPHYLRLPLAAMSKRRGRGNWLKQEFLQTGPTGRVIQASWTDSGRTKEYDWGGIHVSSFWRSDLQSLLWLDFLLIFLKQEMISEPRMSNENITHSVKLLRMEQNHKFPVWVNWSSRPILKLASQHYDSSSYWNHDLLRRKRSNGIIASFR